ncbi:Hypothetical predicted protein, partial [Podarcis lilfordi]
MSAPPACAARAKELPSRLRERGEPGAELGATWRMAKFPGSPLEESPKKRARERAAPRRGERLPHGFATRIS